MQPLDNDIIADTDNVSATYFVQKLGVSRTTFFKMRTQDVNKLMPQPIPLGLERPRYNKQEVDAYARWGDRWRSHLELETLR